MHKHTSGPRRLDSTTVPDTLSQRMWLGQAELIRAAAASVGQSTPDYVTENMVIIAAKQLGLADVPQFPPMNRRTSSAPPPNPAERMAEIQAEMAKLIAEAKRIGGILAPRKVANSSRP